MKSLRAMGDPTWPLEEIPTRSRQNQPEAEPGPRHASLCNEKPHKRTTGRKRRTKRRRRRRRRGRNGEERDKHQRQELETDIERVNVCFKIGGCGCDSSRVA